MIGPKIQKKKKKKKKQMQKLQLLEAISLAPKVTLSYVTWYGEAMLKSDGR